MAKHLLTEPPPDGFARVYFFDGRVLRGKSDSSFDNHAHADDLVDGITVGGVNHGQLLVVDVPIGTHAVGWRNHGTDDPIKNQLTVELHTGQRVFISNDLATAPINPYAAPFMLFGAVGGAIAGAIDAGTSDEPIGDVMTVRDNGAEMAKGYDVVLPDAAAVAKVTPRP